MTSLLDVHNLAVVHLRTAIPVAYGKLCKAEKHVKTGNDTAVLLNQGYVFLDLTDKLRIYLNFESIYPFFRTENLLLIFLELFCDISLCIDQSLLSYPFRRNGILMSIADFEIISENIVETDLKR